MIKTPVPYTHKGTHLEGFAVYPDQKKRPLVILCHAWRGRDDFICEKAELVAKLGYIGFAIDMYGKGILGKTKEENAQLKKPFIDDRSLLQERLLAGFSAACSLPNADPSRIVAIGFGLGGICALDLARSEVDIKGVVSIYGHFEPPSIPTHPIKAKVLIFHGYNDPVSPMSELIAFQDELSRQQVDWQTHLFGNTMHAFATSGANDPAAGIMYNPLAAERAWQLAMHFLKESI